MTGCGKRKFLNNLKSRRKVKMKSKKLTNRKKLDYEKPGIKEEITFEQKALACAPSANSKTGQKIGCGKPPGTHGHWMS
jgi:hypothetical protein